METMSFKKIEKAETSRSPLNRFFQNLLDTPCIVIFQKFDSSMFTIFCFLFDHAYTV